MSIFERFFDRRQQIKAERQKAAMLRLERKVHQEVVMSQMREALLEIEQERRHLIQNVLNQTVITLDDALETQREIYTINEGAQERKRTVIVAAGAHLGFDINAGSPT